MAKWTRGKKSMGGDAIARRKQALKMLEEDLKTGKIRTGSSIEPYRPMDEKDRKRVMSEIENIKKKI